MSYAPGIGVLPDDFWRMVIDKVCELEGLCAAKQLRSYARVSKLFARAAKRHPDNNAPSACGSTSRDIGQPSFV